MSIEAVGLTVGILGLAPLFRAPSEMSIEAVGLTVGILGLAPLFRSAVECFEFELAKSLGSNYQIAQLKVDSAQLRLSHWGTATGLESFSDVASLQQPLGANDDVAHAEYLLARS
jgi:hypothetical protein